MRIIRRFISLYALMLFSLIPLSSISFAQPKQEETTPPINVASLLAETGYKYVEVRKGLWKIPDLSYQGKNLKKLNIFLEPDTSNESLRISVDLGFFPMTAGTTQFVEKMNELNKRYEPTKFLLSSFSLFAVTKLPTNKLDKKMLEKVIKELADVSDQADPELAKFMELERKENTGSGKGGGMGIGTGSGSIEPRPSVSKMPETSQSNVARTVDTRPVVLSRVNPGYTDKARNNNVQGIVRLRILIDADGTVKVVNIVSGLPDGLNEKAIEAAKKMTFKPAMKDGKAVAFWIAIEMTFALR